MLACSPTPSDSAKSFEVTQGGLARPEQTEEAANLERRRDAHRRDLVEARGRRDTRNLALDEGATGLPSASSEQPRGSALLAIDGDPTTAWRGAPGAGPWRWTLPFRRVVHLGLLRFHLGDDTDDGAPAAFRWEYQAPVGERCEPRGEWRLLGRRDDRDDNTFVHGPRDVHAQRQALFADASACALRLVVDEVERGKGPVLRELKILEGAPSLARFADAQARPGWRGGPLGDATPEGLIDGTYERFWAGQPGAGVWEVHLTLPEPRSIDRISLRLGYDAATTERPAGPGLRYTGAHLPLAYTIATSHDDDPAHLIDVPEAEPPSSHGEPLPVRRRLVKLQAPRPVKTLRMRITRATGPWGERSADLAAPVIREIGLYASDDPRPVVQEPLFLSVNANPSGLTDQLKGGEAFADGLFARDAYHRLRRVVLGFDADTRWPADASRKRDHGTGRFLEVIEGDDPQLAAPLLEAMHPPPMVILSGSFDWEFDGKTEPWPHKKGHWSWDVDAPATATDRGMGQLRDAVRGRVAPFLGFCGGAQILALFEASPARRPNDDPDDPSAIDAVLLRNANRPIRGLIDYPEPYERAWWTDAPDSDARRPVIQFDPHDPLFNAPLDRARTASREIPSSHGDMIRASAFQGLLSRFQLVAWSDLCRFWVTEGPEPVFPDPHDPGRRCVRVPQAFRSRDPRSYPVVGFQFHPEQRDLKRFAPDSPHAARGDALNLIANTVDLTLEAYTRLYWPDA